MRSAYWYVTDLRKSPNLPQDEGDNPVAAKGGIHHGSAAERGISRPLLVLVHWQGIKFPATGADRAHLLPKTGVPEWGTAEAGDIPSVATRRGLSRVAKTL